jgi:lysophospholipase L1-like esterase
MSHINDTTTATSTATVPLSGGTAPFASLLPIGATIPHVCVQDSSGNWEISTYVLTDGKTLTRQFIESSSNAGQPVTFAAGSKNVYTTISDSAVIPFARLSADALGNSRGVIGLDGILHKLGQGRVYSAFLAGDSETAFAEANIGASSIVDNGDGTATVVFPTAHGACVNQTLRINVAPVQKLNVMDSYVLSVPDSKTLIIKLTDRTHTVTGGVPNVIFPWRRGTRGWFNWFERALGVSLKTTWCAVGGATIEQISALVDATPIQEVHDIAILCAGMNNFYSPAGTTVADAKAKLKALADKVLARGSIAVFMAVPPRNSADTSNWTSAKQAVHTAINRWLHLYAQQKGAIFFDPSTATQNGLTYMDPTATNPDPVTAFMFDFTHPSGRGAQAWGFGLAALVAPFMGIKPWKPAHRAQLSADTGNKLVNADFATSSAGVANTWTLTGITSGLSLTPTVVQRTVVNDGDAVGWNQVFTVNYGTVASGFGLFTWQRSGLQTLFTPGATVQWKLMFSVANAIGLLALEFTITGTLSDGTTWTVYDCGLDGNTKGMPGTYGPYPLQTPPAVVPAGLTNVVLSMRGIIDSTQTTDMTIKLFWNELLEQI